MGTFQQTRAPALFSFFLLLAGAGIVHGHNYPRNLSIPDLGLLIGYYNTHTYVISFQGIPYAKPPVGELRFKLPQPVFWNETRDTKNMSVSCMQTKTIPGSPLSEDCLYLNVYVPGNETDETAKIPVMVWIHGDTFNTGSSNDNVLKYLAHKGKVIIVTLNFRLNIFGFLSSGDKTLPGNAGLHDQVMALKWVQKHIGTFGGDPDNVTIFGRSAGAVSIYVLLANPTLTKGLFQRAIIQSGVVSPVTTPKKAFKTIANLTNCPHIHLHGKDHDYSTRKQIECMQGKTADELLDVVRNQRSPIFGPVIDEVLLNSPISKQLADNKNNGVPCMIGATNDEIVLESDIVDMTVLKKHLSSLGHPPYNPTVVQLLLSKFLTKDLNRTYVDASNSHVLASIQNLATLVSGPKHVFTYYFTYKPISFPVPNAENVMLPFPVPNVGNEIPYVFGNVFKTFKSSLNLSSPVTPEDELLSDDMIAIWSSFARDGVPALPNNITWPPYDKTTRSYVELNLNITAENVKQELRESDRIFWNEIIPKMLNLTAEPKEDQTMGGHMKMPTTTMGHMHHMESKDKSIAWGMSEKAVKDLLMSLVICLAFVVVVCAALICILCKVRTIKLAATRQNGVVGITAPGGNVNKAFANESHKNDKIESITAL